MYDVIVVGSGPAGSTASRILSTKGYNVLLLEKFKLPRVKPCAGGIGHRVWLEYKEIVEKGLPIRKAFFVSPSGYAFETEAKEILAYDLSRDKFDYELVKLAQDSGVQVLDKTEVIGVKIEKDQVIIYTKKGEHFSSRTVIGADGINSVVARSVKLMPSNWFEDNAFCPIALIPWSPTENEEPMHEFYFGILGEGYGWVFPHIDHLNVGIGTLKKNYNNPVKDLMNFLSNHPILSKRVKGKPTRILGHYIPYNGMLRKIYSNRVVLVGDAGGFVNTLTGEGISMAIRTAKIASEVLSKALDEDKLDEENLAEYQARAERHPEVGEELRIGRIIRTMLFKDLNVLDELIREASNNRRLLDMLLDLIYVRKPYPKLVKEMVRITPISLLIRLFKTTPSDALQLVLGGRDPYFPEK